MHCMTLISGSSGEGDGWSYGSCVQPQNQGHRNHGAPGQGQTSFSPVDCCVYQNVPCVIDYILCFLQKGNSKIVDSCNLPLTGKNCVDMIITDKVRLQIWLNSN